MVCQRCIMVVQQTLENQMLQPVTVNLGEVTVQEDNLSAAALHTLDDALQAVGFERIDDRRARLVEEIKKTVIQRIYNPQGIDRRLNWSDILADALHYEYNYLSNVFSAIEGITLEQFIIRQKIERVKELLAYDELTLSEIAHRLGYSSVAHLSAQFKKIAGQTPTAMRKAAHTITRTPLDAL